MRHKNVLILSLLVIVFATSCTQRLMDFTIISSKNVELSKFPDYEKGQHRTAGKDKKPIIVIVPTGQPDAKEALDRAIESTPGAVALLDGVLTYKQYYIPYIYGESTYIVEGTPLIDPALASKEKFENSEGYSVCILNKQGEVKKSVNFDKEEYKATKEKIFNSPDRMYRKLTD